MGFYICENGHEYEGEDGIGCPYCGSFVVRPNQYAKKEEYNADGKKKRKYVDLDGEKELKNENGFGNRMGRGMVVIAVVLSLLLAISGGVFFFISNYRVREYQEKIEELNKKSDDQNVKSEPEDVVISAEQWVRYENYTRSFKLENGSVYKWRNQAEFTLKVTPVPADATIPVFQWESSDSERVSIIDNKLIIDKDAYTKKSSVTVTGISEDGRFKVTFDIEVAHTGFNTIGEHIYFITDGDAIYRNEWHEKHSKANNGKAYLNEEGIAIIGWLQITQDGVDRAFYFDENAIWIADQKMTIDGQECTFHKDGYLVTGWLCTREDAVEKWYYYDDGAMVRGTSLEINGKEYSFDEEGICLSKP